MDTPLLDRIAGPEDVKKLSKLQVIQLCGEIRRFLVDSVLHTGGHLASNLGTVELTVALHRVLDSPRDKLVFDVGHQCYTHKLLTGRKAGFAHLRQLDGISGFPNPRESVHDAFIAGHGNTALSLAIGMAWAKKLKGEPGWVVAIIGDGAFTGGMVYEGMNNIAALDNLMVILNDNKMSISKNVGAIARYLTQLRADPEYFRVNRHLSDAISEVPLIGPPLRAFLSQAKAMVRRAMYHSTMFEDMGFQYFGPLDGHNEEALERTLRNLCARTGPLFLHVVTTKGKGYPPAEENPGEYHGVSASSPGYVPDPEVSAPASFSTAFGKALCEAAAADPKICAITAAMKYGTGLQFFGKAFPSRFFDVGMAEQHEITFAAGLASQGMTPVAAIYSTFLQRAYDQIIHDVGLLQVKVVFAIDRAGLVPADGETHQGIYDPAFLSQVGIPTYSPSNYAELRYWLLRLLRPDRTGPQAIRYPRGGEVKALASYGCTGRDYDFLQDPVGAKAVLVSYGSEVEDVLAAASLLAERKIVCSVCKFVKIYPFTEELLHDLMRFDVVLFAEECVERGGIGQQLTACLCQLGWQGAMVCCGVDNTRLTHATVPELKAIMGLDGEHLAQTLQQALQEKEERL